MTFPLKQLDTRDFPLSLRELPEPPKQLWVRGTLPSPQLKKLAVVGSRKMTSYGKACCESLIAPLRGYPITIISGLALGIDATAHSAGLAAGLHTMAVPGSGIDDSVLYPRTNYSLAQKILHAGGCLFSEFEPTFKATEWSFPRRNRIMVGLADAVLVIEAGEKSGTLITARLTAEYNKDLLVVPGSIFSENSKGVHQFLKLGATPVTEYTDILEALHLDVEEKRGVENLQLSPDERHLYEALTDRLTKEELTERTRLTPQKINIILTQLALKSVITESGGYIRKT